MTYPAAIDARTAVTASVTRQNWSTAKKRLQLELEHAGHERDRANTLLSARSEHTFPLSGAVRMFQRAIPQQSLGGLSWIPVTTTRTGRVSFLSHR
jgi:hypothetical protein